MSFRTGPAQVSEAGREALEDSGALLCLFGGRRAQEGGQVVSQRPGILLRPSAWNGRHRPGSAGEWPALGHR